MLNLLVLFTMSLSASIPAFATESLFRAGSFFMMNAPGQERTDCDLGRELRLYLKGDLMLADTLDAVDGDCPISTAASRRTYLLSVEDTGGCNIVRMRGESYSDSGVSTIEIMDYRRNDCGDYRAARVVATETFPRGETRVWHSQHNRGW